MMINGGKGRLNFSQKGANCTKWVSVSNTVIPTGQEHKSKWYLMPKQEPIFTIVSVVNTGTQMFTKN